MEIHFSSALVCLLFVIFEISESDMMFTRNKRGTNDVASPFGVCKHYEDDIIYCAFDYHLQLGSQNKISKAETLACFDDSDEKCPTKFNTSVPYQGCHHTHACVQECKVLGSYCFRRRVIASAGTFDYDCCNARLTTTAGKVIQVSAECNEKTQVCEPKFPINAVCGDWKKTYVGCYTDAKLPYNRCQFGAQVNTTSTNGLTRVSRLTQQNSQTEEPKRCVQWPAEPCDPTKPLKIFCGPNLPKMFDNFPFCDCPNADLKTGFHCVNKKCTPCKLKGSCSVQSDCCVRHNCFNGQCQLEK